MLLGIHHAAIICSNYQVSKAFYVDILGLKIIDENFRQARQSYKLDLSLPDGSKIELFSFNDAPKRPSYPEAQGLRHLAFEVVSVSDVASQLQQKGIDVEPIRVDEFTGKSFTFFSDPDGLPLEIYQQ